MKRQLVATIIIFAAPFLFVACVSSILKGSPPTFSSEVEYKDPTAPFAKLKKSVYPSWKSQKTGNVISIVSDCDPNSSLSLAQLHRMVEDSLTGVQVVNEEGAFLQDKPALVKNIKGQLDGIDIELVSISFRRKSCGYVSSLSGKVGSIQQDRAEFDRFNQNLKF
jgi:hypothetical protein